MRSMLIDPKPHGTWSAPGTGLLVGTWKVCELAEPQFELHELIGGFFNRTNRFRIICKVFSSSSLSFLSLFNSYFSFFFFSPSFFNVAFSKGILIVSNFRSESESGFFRTHVPGGRGL